MIFISYSREDEPKVREIAEAIRFRTGYDLWRDVRIRGGEEFRDKIESALSDAKAVIVFWSKQSVKSRWVIGEASRAHKNRKLVPVKIDDCDLPLDFETLNTISLEKFDAAPLHGDEGLSQLISALNRFEKLPYDILTIALTADQTDSYELMSRITGGVEVVMAMNSREAVGGMPFQTGLNVVGFTAHLTLEIGEYSGENVRPILSDLRRADLILLTFFPTLLASPHFYEFLISQSGSKPIFIVLFGPIEYDALISRYGFLESIPKTRIIRRKGVGFPLDGEAAKETWDMLRTLLRSIEEKQV